MDIAAIDPFLIASLILLTAAVVGSVVPMMPGPVFSLLGVGLYWWHTGYTEPSLLFVVFAFGTALFALVVDWFAGAISAKAGGASNVATVAAAVVGLVLLFVLGPVGIVVGVAGTVILIELYHGRTPERSIKSGLYTVIGVLASAAVQAVLTAAILIGFVIAVM